MRSPQGQMMEHCAFSLSIKTHRAAGDVSISPVRRYAEASILRLVGLSVVGPAAEATAGVTLGGAAVDEFGRWVPSSGGVLNVDHEEIVVDLPTSSAAVVSLRLNKEALATRTLIRD
jgi:hypothetical protein